MIFPMHVTVAQTKQSIAARAATQLTGKHVGETHKLPQFPPAPFREEVAAIPIAGETTAQNRVGS